MKRRLKRKFSRYAPNLGVAALMALGGCRIFNPPAPAPEPSPAPPLHRITTLRLPDQWYAVRGVLKYEGDQKLTSPFLLRMKPDSVIWLSVTPVLGIEALRARVHQDDGDILNRLERKHYHYERADLGHAFLPDSLIDLAVFQHILWGIPIIRSLDDYRWQTSDTAIVGETSAPHFIDRIVLDPATLRLKSRRYDDLQARRRILIEYADYQAIDDGMPYPGRIVVTVVPLEGQRPLTQVTLLYKKVTTAPHMEVPFSIPESYERGP